MQEPTGIFEFVALATVPFVFVQLVADVSNVALAQLSFAGAWAVAENDNRNSIHNCHSQMELILKKYITCFIGILCWSFL